MFDEVDTSATNKEDFRHLYPVSWRHNKAGSVVALSVLDVYLDCASSTLLQNVIAKDLKKLEAETKRKELFALATPQ